MCTAMMFNGDDHQRLSWQSAPLRCIRGTAMSRSCFVVALSLFLAAPAWGGEARLNAEQTREFMKQLAQYVFDHHLRRDAKSLQRGMIYEYFEPTKKNRLGKWIQGEALDTMHDGAWFVSALAQAFRATGE